MGKQRQRFHHLLTETLDEKPTFLSLGFLICQMEPPTLSHTGWTEWMSAVAQSKHACSNNQVGGKPQHMKPNISAPGKKG